MKKIFSLSEVIRFIIVFGLGSIVGDLMLKHSLGEIVANLFKLILTIFFFYLVMGKEQN